MEISDKLLQALKKDIHGKSEKFIFKELSLRRHKQYIIHRLQKRAISVLYPPYKKAISKLMFITFYNEQVDAMLEKGNLTEYETAAHFYLKIKE